MKTQDLEKFLSEARLSSYYNLFDGDKTRGIEYYRLNSEVSESFYILLANLEIGLRNTINSSFTIRFNTANWFDKLPFNELTQMVDQAKQKIKKSKRHISNDKVIAELTFGFWTSLFNRQYAKDFWKPLMFAFPNITKTDLHRDKIAFRLNQVRKFRNRIFHYEPICNDLEALQSNKNAIVEILNWLNKDVYHWTGVSDKLEQQIMQLKEYRLTSHKGDS
jgi:hypothetical protein